MRRRPHTTPSLGRSTCGSGRTTKPGANEKLEASVRSPLGYRDSRARWERTCSTEVLMTASLGLEPETAGPLSGRPEPVIVIEPSHGWLTLGLS